LLSIEVKEEVNSLLENLNTRDKEIFTKRYLEDLDIETIAKQLNTQTSTIYTRISRCKKKLRSLVSKY
ncbi:MAG: sigma-70 family RNA polymerase sigma factor, partial [Paraclostridium sp.]